MSYGSNMQSKESIIEEYLKNVNFNDAKLNLNIIKKDLKKLLLEEPGIKLEWKTERTLNEVNNNITIVDKVASVKIYYTTEVEGQLMPKSVTYYGV